MQKQVFDPAGVQAWQEALYALSDAQLQVEATEARLQFKMWLHKQFDFSPTQAAYVDDLDGDFVSITSGVVSQYVGHRLPIALAIVTPPIPANDDDDDDEGRGKLILLNESQQTVYGKGEGLLTVGHLQLTIRQAST